MSASMTDIKMSNKPLVVIDTSVFISAFLSSNFDSTPNQVINRWRGGDFILVMTPQIEEEIGLLLNRKKFSEDIILDLFSTFDNLALMKEGIYQTNYLDNIDPNDNIFLSASYESKADYLVSLDKHLLNLKHFHQTLIFNPQSFLNQLEQY